MSVSVTSNLNPSQKAQIQSIIEASKEKEPVTASFPYDDADFYALFEVDGVIRSAAAFLAEDEETYECSAFTDPAYRCQGMFSELLDAAIEELPEDTAFVFYTNGASGDCMAAIEALEAEKILEEHMMELSLEAFLLGSERLLSMLSDSQILPISMEEREPDGTKTYHYKHPHGTVNISVFSSYYYLYGLEIEEAFRGQGYGNAFLLAVLGDLAHRNPLPLRLQVSGENIPALSLYKKTGFQITETLFGYLY